MAVTKTLRILQRLRPNQACKYVVELEDNGTKHQLATFTEKARAEGFVQGLRAGLQHGTNYDNQTAVPIFVDEWN